MNIHFKYFTTKYISKIIFIIFIISIVCFNSANSSDHSSIIFCDPGSWNGNSLSIENGVVENSENRFTLKSALYVISRDQKKVINYFYDGKPIKFSNMHYFENFENSTRYYFVISYVYGNVLNTDTIFSDGQVFTQYSKLSIGIIPSADSFGKQCELKK